MRLSLVRGRVAGTPIVNVEATAVQEPSAWDDPAPWRELFKALAFGRGDALEQIYDMGNKRMFGLALWRTGSIEDASEVVQEVFVRVVQQGSKLLRIEDPRWWLLRLTRSAAIDVTRRRRPTEPLDDHPYLIAPNSDPGRSLDARRVSSLIARLSLKQREVVYLYHYAGMSYAEIGQALGIPKFTAASRHRLALATLRRLLEGIA